ncbi:MAG: hypothetical protein HUU56_04770 [Bdellovibrionaceae bacterium]|nr:hypothetical protein [Pseudobdellovibrionaceae bacterium]
MISSKNFSIFSFSLCCLLSFSVGAIELPKVFRSGRGGEAKFIRDARYWRESKQEYVRKLSDDSLLIRNGEGEIEVLRPPSSNMPDLKIPLPDNYNIAHLSTVGYSSSESMSNGLAWRQNLFVENNKIVLKTGSSAEAFTEHHWNQNGSLTFGQVHTPRLDITINTVGENRVVIGYQYVDRKDEWKNAKREPTIQKQHLNVELPVGDHLTSYKIDSDGSFTLIIKKSDGTMEKRVANLHGTNITWKSQVTGAKITKEIEKPNGKDTDFGVSLK